MAQRFAPARLLRIVGPALLAIAWLGLAPGSPARGDGECRITGGHGTVALDVPADENTWFYQGAIFVHTEDCGTGVKEVYGTFRPVGGTPASCEPRPSHQIDVAVCSFAGSAGIGLPGTPVEVSATAFIAGAVRVDQSDDAPPEASPDPGTDESESVCVLSLPEEGSRRACALFTAP